ncbi:MAG: hypothetical protein KDI43_13050, partial [Gammaproteobacteria bacterium]|nr:hypothetical protein [Gammaproteobacteria bacterium]
MIFFQFRSYFWKILVTIGIISIGFLFIMLSAIAYYMVVPLGQRATDDLASIITHAAERWESLPSGERDLFVEQMWQKHSLQLTTPDSSLPESTSLLPYLFFLEASLKKQLGKEIRL